MVVVALLLLLGWLLFMYPGWTAELALVRKVAHLQARARILDSVYRARLATLATSYSNSSPRRPKSAMPPSPDSPVVTPTPDPAASPALSSPSQARAFAVAAATSPPSRRGLVKNSKLVEPSRILLGSLLNTPPVER